MKVRTLENKDQSFFALIDTRSSVSLIRKSIYLKFFQNNEWLQVSDNLKLKAVNNLEITTSGIIYEQLCFEKLQGHYFDVTLLIIKDTTMRLTYCWKKTFLIIQKCV